MAGAKNVVCFYDYDQKAESSHTCQIKKSPRFESGIRNYKNTRHERESRFRNLILVMVLIPTTMSSFAIINVEFKNIRCTS